MQTARDNLTCRHRSISLSHISEAQSESRFGTFANARHTKQSQKDLNSPQKSRNSNNLLKI